MAADASKSTSSADSYIGSLISLTSKSEIRYEGVLYSINADESSIGLRNVRSFGSEGRKKDGPQIPPSDRLYEYILFRGTDIKDLQVKSAPPVQNTITVDNDPAIIQSHYPSPPALSTSFPSSVSVSSTNVNAHAPQMGHPGSNFLGGMPLYHHGASLGSWTASSPPIINSNSLPMPVYWPGMYGPPNVIPHLHQQTFLPPPPDLSVTPLLQQPMPYSGLSAPPQAASSSSTLPATSNSSSVLDFNPPPTAGSLNVPSSSSPLLAACSSSTSLPSSSLPFFSLPVLPSLQQPMLYSGFNAPAQAAALNVPASSLMLFTTSSSSSILGFNPPPPAVALNVPSTSSASISASSSFAALTSSSLPTLSLPVVPSLTGASEAPMASLTISDSATISSSPPVSGKVNTVPGSTLPYQNLPQAAISVSSSAPNKREVLIPSLVTPRHLLKSEQSRVSSQSSKIAHKDAEVAQVSSSSSELSGSAPKEKEAQPPILPLPAAPRPYHKPNGAPQVRYNHRQNGRGRGRGGSRPVARFTEDFDFTAMNEKFNKDEVWDHLGKSCKSHTRDKEGDEGVYEDGELPRNDVKPMYNKDDFFDTLSSNARDNESQKARPRFSEQLKIDTETFGEFATYRGGRGGRGTSRGGRGSNYGRSYSYAGSQRGYSYAVRGRGRGRTISSEAS